MYCKNEGEGCAIKDDIQMVYEDFKKANVVVIGCPIYVYQVSAQTKILFDRFYALLDKSYKPRFDKKRAVILYSQGQANEGVNNSIYKLLKLNDVISFLDFIILILIVELYVVY